MLTSTETPRHAVVIDDAPELRLLFESYLRALGLTVTTLASGQHALTTIRAERPALVLLDIMLPNVCGLDLCEQIRRDPDISETPIILTSARTSPQDRANAELAGASLFMPKPVRPGQLAEYVARLLVLESARP